MNVEYNILSNIRGIINEGEGKNYALPDCMAFLMERIGEPLELNYWLFVGITGDGLTQVYNKNNTISCEYCVSGYLAGPQHTAYIFYSIGYDYNYVTADQINVLPENNGMFFGAQAFRAWADDIENGRYENEKDLWANYCVYVSNLASNAGNSGNEPYIIKKFAEIDTQYTDMCNQILNLYVKMSNQEGGVWKALEDLGGGFNVTLEVMRDKERRSQISSKIREAAVCLDKVVKILRENLK